jgi:NADH:quinone reductase (non-electrogenic)
MISMVKKSVVVLGAGFGGLRAAMDVAKGLQKMKLDPRVREDDKTSYEVVLIDRNDCHLYTPFLYKLAAAPEVKSDICTYDTSSLVKNFPIRFVQGEIASLDLPNGAVHLKTGEDIHADYLVIALGSETNYFGIPGLKENALQLKSAEHAMQIRAALTKVFAKGGTVNIVAGGAGPNGIELASEMRVWATHAQQENPNLHVFVSIVEAMPNILPGFDPKVAAHAELRLKKLGIAIKTDAKITGVSANEITIDGGEKIPFDVFVWTGGIKTPDMVIATPLEKEPRGKPLAKSDMICTPGTPDLKLAPMVYGLGDSVCFMNPKTGKPVPAVARAAITEGSIAAHNILEDIRHSEMPTYDLRLMTYDPPNYPYVIPIGENWAVAKLGPIVFWGWAGAMFEKLIALNYLISIMPLGKAMEIWKTL